MKSRSIHCHLNSRLMIIVVQLLGTCNTNGMDKPYKIIKEYCNCTNKNYEIAILLLVVRHKK